MALPVSVQVIPTGGAQARDITELLDGGVRFATAAVGGFADATFTLRGDQRRILPYLALVRISLGVDVLYEGQIEDADPAGTPNDLRTTVTCFGLRNLLEEVSVRRIWSKRDFEWSTPPVGAGGKISTTSGVDINRTTTGFAVSTGAVVPTDLSQNGVNFAGNNVSVPNQAGEAVDLVVPSGLTLQRIMGTVTGAGAFAGAPLDFLAFSGYTTDGTTWTSFDFVGSGTLNQSIANAIRVRVGAYNGSGGALTPTSADTVRFTDIRALGTSLTEDASGGFYGGTILNDLIALVPGLTIGVIETGSDYTIQAIERAARDSALSVVQEVASYYTREWAVWESGRFDWKTRALDLPDWIVTTADCESLSVNGTLNGIARTIYILYADAASGVDAEASASATAQRNPYVKQGRAKDVLERPGFPMTANTSAQLATRIAADVGQWIPVEGTITLPVTRVVSRAAGAAAPAVMIRAGDNIAITDLPKSDLFAQGRDGETLFHVVGTDCDLERGIVTLELEGQSTRTDVILARLAAVTRTLTG